MNVYLYIAQTSPDSANAICKKYGYSQVQSISELAYCLKRVVAEKGEEAFKEIMEIHPEKDVILELFEKKTEIEPVMERERKRDCSCMMNADGQANLFNQNAANQNAASQTNMIILAAALIVSISIISMKK
jgi:hypothetical protein